MAIEDRIRLPPLSLIQRRPRLLAMLDDLVNSGKRLITIYALGGYGKSILLADFAQTTDLPVCWCSIEPTDRDPTAFLTLLTYSITNRFHEIPFEPLKQLVERGNTDDSIRRIAELLQGVGEHIIIIDDYHKAVSKGMYLSLDKLVKMLPENSILIVAARGDMNLDTEQIIDLVVEGRITGLSEEELRFTPRELKSVMRKRFGRRIELDSAANLATTTEGNIAQILLAGHMMNTGHSVGQLSRGTGEDRDIIYSYLAAEVFGKQPAHIRKFLLHTAILPDVTADMCNKLLDITDAQSVIEEIIRRDLFIIQVGIGYRYHDLFADFLRDKLREDEALHQQVGHKAACLLVAEKRFEEAMEIYLSVPSWAEAASLLEEQGKYFFDTGRAETVDNWFSVIPEQEFVNRPRLMLLQGQILNDHHGQLAEGMAYFQKAEAQFTEQDDSIGLAETLIWQSVSLRFQGEADQSRELAAMGVKKLQALRADKRTLAWAFRNLGISYGIAGNIPRASFYLRKALGLFEKLRDEYRIGLTSQDLGVALVNEGQLSSADRYYKIALRCFQDLGNANDTARTYNNLGVSTYLRGQHESALEYFSEGLRLANEIDTPVRGAYIQAGMGDVYLAQEQYEEAQQCYEKSLTVAQQYNNQPLELHNFVKLGECYFYQNQFSEALSWIDPAYEIARQGNLQKELGLVLLVRGRIVMARGEYEDSAALFAQAMDCFRTNDVLEQVRTELLWSYSLLLNLQMFGALYHLDEANGLVAKLGEAITGLQATIVEVLPLLHHFLDWANTDADTRESINRLLELLPRDAQRPDFSLRVFALGSPYIVIDGWTDPFRHRGSKSQRLPEFLLYLILEGQDVGCRRNEVALALWPDAAPDEAADKFHQHLQRVRRSSKKVDYFLVENDTYRCDPNYLYWCDALVFEKLWERINNRPVAEALSFQAELVKLYNGSFLEGFELGEWGIQKQSEFEIKFSRVVNMLGTELLRQHRFSDVVSMVEQGLAIDYFYEEFHRLAMKALAAQEEFRQLDSHYQKMATQFEAEGLPLTSDMVALYNKLRPR